MMCVQTWYQDEMGDGLIAYGISLATEEQRRSLGVNTTNTSPSPPSPSLPQCNGHNLCDEVQEELHVGDPVSAETLRSDVPVVRPQSPHRLRRHHPRHHPTRLRGPSMRRSPEPNETLFAPRISYRSPKVGLVRLMGLWVVVT